MSEETTPNIKECGALRRTFQKMEDVSGSICCLKEGYLWILNMSTFGNLDDKCWELLMMLDVPVFYEEKDVNRLLGNITYKRIVDPDNTEWVVNTDVNQIGFYNGNDLVMNGFYRIGILLSNATTEINEIHFYGKPTTTPISIDEGMRWAIDCALDKYDTNVPKWFVRRVLEYYQNRRN